MPGAGAGAVPDAAAVPCSLVKRSPEEAEANVALAWAGGRLQLRARRHIAAGAELLRWAPEPPAGTCPGRGGGGPAFGGLEDGEGWGGMGLGARSGAEPPPGCWHRSPASSAEVLVPAPHRASLPGGKGAWGAALCLERNAGCETLHGYCRG